MISQTGEGKADKGAELVPPAERTKTHTGRPEQRKGVQPLSTLEARMQVLTFPRLKGKAKPCGFQRGRKSVSFQSVPYGITYILKLFLRMNG